VVPDGGPRTPWETDSHNSRFLWFSGGPVELFSISCSNELTHSRPRPDRPRILQGRLLESFPRFVRHAAHTCSHIRASNASSRFSSRSTSSS